MRFRERGGADDGGEHGPSSSDKPFSSSCHASTMSQVLTSYTAKFHNTGPTGFEQTGPDQTKSADFVGDPRGPAQTQRILSGPSSGI